MTGVTTQNASGATTSFVETPGETVPPAWRDVLSANASTALPWRAFRFKGGARYDWTHSRADSTPTSFTSKLDVVESRPSVEGGVSFLTGAFEPYAHAGTSFRAPNLEERYYNDEIHGGLRLFGNPDLVAEHGVNYEAGLRVHGERASMRVSAYRSDVADFISLKYLGQLYLVPRFQYVNLQRARIEGIELTASTRVGAAGINLYAALPQGHDLDTGERLTDVGAPRVTLEYTQRCDGIAPLGTFALRGRWTAAVPAEPSPDPSTELARRPAFWTADAEMAFSIAGARATFAVRNIFDLRYREPLSFIDEPGRTVAVKLQRDFALPVLGPMGRSSR
jgi:hemoglobin/transferrin/lactoferrin receptor protein